jgi:hypothetical protein
VGLTTEVGPVVSDGASRVVRCCTASCGTVDEQIDKQPVADGPPRRAVDRVAALNSIPDCTTSLFALVLLVAFATRIRHKMIRKMINWLKKGAVIKMVRKVIAGPWWASACALGATALTRAYPSLLRYAESVPVGGGGVRRSFSWAGSPPGTLLLQPRAL